MLKNFINSILEIFFSLAHKTCPHCNQKIFTNKKLLHHIKKYHTIPKRVEHKCDSCEKVFSKKFLRDQHQKDCRKKAHIMNEIKDSWVKNGLNIK